MCTCILPAWRLPSALLRRCDGTRLVGAVHSCLLLQHMCVPWCSTKLSRTAVVMSSAKEDISTRCGVAERRLALIRHPCRGLRPTMKADCMRCCHAKSSSAQSANRKESIQVRNQAPKAAAASDAASNSTQGVRNEGAVMSS